MRLIDADDLLTQVRQVDFLKTPNSTKLSACEIMKIINRQPTAYNVDAVVEEIEHAKEMSLTDMGKSYNKGLDFAIIQIKKAGGKV